MPNAPPTAGPSLKVISTVSAGYDHVETEALKKRGVKLGTSELPFRRRSCSALTPPSLSACFLAATAPDALTDATADITAMLVLMSSRRAGEVSAMSMRTNDCELILRLRRAFAP